MPSLGDTRLLKPGELPPPGWQKVPGTKLVRYMVDERGPPGRAPTIEEIEYAVGKWMEDQRASLKGDSGLAGKDGLNGRDADPITPQQIATEVHSWMLANAEKVRGLRGDDGYTPTESEIKNLFLAWAIDSADRFKGEPGASGVGVEDMALTRDGNSLEVLLSDGRLLSFWVRGPRGRDGDSASGGGSAIDQAMVNQAVDIYLNQNPALLPRDVFVQEADPGSPPIGRARLWVQQFAGDVTAFDFKFWNPAL